MEYLQYPSSVKELAHEIKKIINDYNARKITNDELREHMLYYSIKYPEKIFKANSFNPTLSLVVGKKRLSVLEKVLSDSNYQYHI